ncbi:hypothetical protein FOFC_03272 [Fusarium oxysporum]|nr:hypothetical protein FOFC_03272 [Fusarium oxysporum]
MLKTTILQWRSLVLNLGSMADYAEDAVLATQLTCQPRRSCLAKTLTHSSSNYQVQKRCLILNTLNGAKKDQLASYTIS